MSVGKITPTQREMFEKADATVATVAERDSYIAGAVVDFPAIAHIGCAASPNTVEKLKAGTLLHERIARQRPKRLVGIDIDGPGLDELARAVPESEYLNADISTGATSLSGQFDLVLLAEVLEHVPDPGSLLTGAAELLRPGGKACITGPNALSARTGLRAVVGREVVHPDHYVYFSPKTMARTMEGAGLQVNEVLCYMNMTEPGTRGRVLNTVLRRLARRGSPVGEGIIAWGSL